MVDADEASFSKRNGSVAEDSGQLIRIPINAWSICITLAILYAIYYFLLKKKVSKGNNVLIVGPSNSGKSVLFGRLMSGKTVDTYVSMKENQGVLKITYKKTKKARLVDVPGHESIRFKFFDQFKLAAGALIFVLDASTFQKDLKDTAEFMYTILTDQVVLRYKLSVLVVCNKQDLISAKSSTLVKMALEKELNQLRTTHDAALDGVDGSRMKNQLGSGQKFSFDDLTMNKADFVELDGKAVDSGLEKIKEWIYQAI